MNSLGISADKFNERLLQIAEVLKPLGVSIMCDERNYAEVTTHPQGAFITRLDVSLSFSEPVTEKELSKI